MTKLFSFSAIFILLVGCGTAYQKMGFTGGYTETQLGENIFNVSFQGNGYTSRERASDFLLSHIMRRNRAIRGRNLCNHMI